MTKINLVKQNETKYIRRLNLDLGGGAWCPMKAISGQTFGKEWIQAKFNKSYVVTAIETQGRFGGKEFVPSYQVEYSRNGGLTWHKWKDLKGSSVSRIEKFSPLPFRCISFHLAIQITFKPNKISTRMTQSKLSKISITSRFREKLLVAEFGVVVYFIGARKYFLEKLYEKSWPHLISK